MKKCHICGVETQDTEPSPTLDCGGDCLSCMAEAGDLDCIETMYRFLKEGNRDLRIQRDELLAALKNIATIEYNENGGDWDEIDEAQDIARAAITKVEKSK